MELTDAELELCRQWFDAVQDLNLGYLDRPDYFLAKKIYHRLGMRVPESISSKVAWSVSSYPIDQKKGV